MNICMFPQDTRLTSHLPEDHLLSGFSGDRLEQQGGGRSRVQVGQETVDTGLSESGQDGAELDELLNSLEVVSVLALLGAAALQDVGEQSRVADLRKSQQNSRARIITHLPGWP